MVAHLYHTILRKKDYIFLRLPIYIMQFWGKKAIFSYGCPFISRNSEEKGYIFLWLPIYITQFWGKKAIFSYGCPFISRNSDEKRLYFLTVAHLYHAILMKKGYIFLRLPIYITQFWWKKAIFSYGCPFISRNSEEKRLYFLNGCPFISRNSEEKRLYFLTVAHLYHAFWGKRLYFLTVAHLYHAILRKKGYISYGCPFISQQFWGKKAIFSYGCPFISCNSEEKRLYFLLLPIISQFWGKRLYFLTVAHLYHAILRKKGYIFLRFAHLYHAILRKKGYIFLRLPIYIMQFWGKKAIFSYGCPFISCNSEEKRLYFLTVAHLYHAILRKKGYIFLRLPIYITQFWGKKAIFSYGCPFISRNSEEKGYIFLRLPIYIMQFWGKKAIFLTVAHLYHAILRKKGYIFLRLPIYIMQFWGKKAIFSYGCPFISRNSEEKRLYFLKVAHLYHTILRKKRLYFLTVAHLYHAILRKKGYIFLRLPIYITQFWGKKAIFSYGCPFISRNSEEKRLYFLTVAHLYHAILRKKGYIFLRLPIYIMQFWGKKAIFSYGCPFISRNSEEKRLYFLMVAHLYHTILRKKGYIFLRLPIYIMQFWGKKAIFSYGCPFISRNSDEKRLYFLTVAHLYHTILRKKGYIFLRLPIYITQFWWKKAIFSYGCPFISRNSDEKRLYFLTVAHLYHTILRKKGYIFLQLPIYITQFWWKKAIFSYCCPFISHNSDEKRLYFLTVAHLYHAILMKKGYIFLQLPIYITQFWGKNSELWEVSSQLQEKKQRIVR